MHAALITHQFSTTNPTPKPGRRKSPYSQALELQELLLSDARNPGVKATARAQVARAWDVLEERKRVLRMKPKPKDVDVSQDAKPRRDEQPSWSSSSELPDPLPSKPKPVTACCQQAAPATSQTRSHSTAISPGATAKRVSGERFLPKVPAEANVLTRPGRGTGDQNSVDRGDKQALTSHQQNIFA
jgi:hypothetical protein